MPKETYGGDGSGGGSGQPKKKMPLSRFGLAPDANIRDLFWRVMASYSATKKPGMDLKEAAGDRFALMRAGLSVLDSPHGSEYGLAPKFIAAYTAMMMLDGGWDDALAELIQRSREARHGTAAQVAAALAKLANHDGYRERLAATLGHMIRDKNGNAAAVACLAAMNEPQFAARMKKELMIVARGDIGENQLNAISAIAGMKDDPDARKSLAVLLSHWDENARLAAAEALAAMPADAEVKAAARKRLAEEPNPEIKKMLAKISK